MPAVTRGHHMKIFWTVMAGVSIAGGIAATLLLIILVLASMANSSPAQLRFLTIVSWSFAVLGLICPAVAGVLLYYAKPMVAAFVAFVPIAASIVFLVLAVKNEW
jgi:uncharacterized integral membrane protein